MKKSTTLLATLVAVGVAGGLYFGVTKSEASATPEQEAKQTIQNYLKAVKSGNVDEMMKLTNDSRFQSDAEKRDVYQSLVEVQDTEKLDVVSVMKNDSTHLNVTVKLVSKTDGTHELTLPFVKENNSWKIFIEGQVVTKN